MVDETQQSEETAATPEALATDAQASETASGPDDLKAFIASGGTFGMAVRDGLAQAQLDPAGAAKMSGDHISNLLYGSQNVNEHTAPYTGRAYPNPNDYRERETTNARRRR